MNENAKAWIDALRSNEYPQSRHALKTSAGYCCLGVACEISKLGEFKPQDSDFYLFFSKTPSGYETQNRGHMPLHIQSHYGLVRNIVVFDADDTAHLGYDSNIAELNDVRGLSFNQIADILEKYQEQLFE
jgi:hypothetical protein